MVRSGIVPVSLALIPTEFSGWNSGNVGPITKHPGRIAFGAYLIRQGGDIWLDDGINDKTIHIEINGTRVGTVVTETDIFGHPGFFAGLYPPLAQPPLEAGTYNVEAVFDGDAIYAGCHEKPPLNGLALLPLLSLALLL